MADSQKVENSNSGSSDNERRDNRRNLPYDPAVLKRLKLWNKSDLGSGDFFGRMGGNNRDSQASTMTIHQGDRKANPPDSKHKEGNTQKYNGPSESRHHGARSNNGAGVTDKGKSAGSAAVSYPSQPIHRGSGGLDSASNGRKWNSDSHSHSARSNGGSGVRTLSASVQYPSQAIQRSRAGLADAQNGLKWNSDSRHHAAPAPIETRAVKMSRGDNTLNRRSL
jgi:hypothetical protein